MQLCKYVQTIAHFSMLRCYFQLYKFLGPYLLTPYYLLTYDKHICIVNCIANTMAKTRLQNKCKLITLWRQEGPFSRRVWHFKGKYGISTIIRAFLEKMWRCQRKYGSQLSSCHIFSKNALVAHQNYGLTNENMAHFLVS